MAHLTCKEKFIIKFVYQFSDNDIMTEVTKVLESTEEYINFINGCQHDCACKIEYDTNIVKLPGGSSTSSTSIVGLDKLLRPPAVDV